MAKSWALKRDVQTLADFADSVDVPNGQFLNEIYENGRVDSSASSILWPQFISQADH